VRLVHRRDRFRGLESSQTEVHRLAEAGHAVIHTPCELREIRGGDRVESVVIEDTVVEGDKIAARVTWHGTHRGDFVGIPGTGAPVSLQSVQILEFVSGMATHWWGTADIYGALRQVGASVSPPTG